MAENREGMEYDRQDPVKDAVDYLRATNQGAFADAIEQRVGTSSKESTTTEKPAAKKAAAPVVNREGNK